MKVLSEINNGDVFSVAGIEFIKFYDEDGSTVAVSKDCLFNSRFGDNNNFATSDIFSRLRDEVLTKIVAEIGEENVVDTETDLLSLDGSEKHGKLLSKISLPTFDFYRKNINIFDKYKPNKWWWLSTPESTTDHSNDEWIVCVSPHGSICYCNFCNYDSGVRPFLRFVSSISVSCEE